jgi:hypothetical protein
VRILTVRVRRNHYRMNARNFNDLVLSAVIHAREKSADYIL